MLKTKYEGAVDALYAIPADLPRDKWVKAAMGFHAAGGSFDDFDQWSAQASNYKPQDCKTTWTSIKDGGGIGAGTLFGMAHEFGWTKSNQGRPQLATNLSFPAPPTSKPAASQQNNDRDPACIWKRCIPVTTEHEYLFQKQATEVPLEGLRVVPEGDSLNQMGESMVGALVVPLLRVDGTIASLQFITVGETAKRLKARKKPTKLNLKGASMDGWFTVGQMKPGGVAYLCEGLGTAWAAWMATGHAAVVCFGAGNIKRVANELRKNDRTAYLVLCPDVGKESQAQIIASDVGGHVAMMPEGWPNNSDLNDLGQRDGFEAVAALLDSAKTPPGNAPLLKPVSVFDVLTHPAPPPAFVWDYYLPRGVVTLLGAHGGTGKSTIALMLSVCAALGRPLFGVNVIHCKTVFVSLEDGANLVRHRLAAICKYWAVDPTALGDNLQIVDGTDYPELFSAENRGNGETTPTYAELHRLVQEERIGLVVVDNASDAFGGDEIQRRQVRAFMRSLSKVARLTDCAVLLLAHVDKTTSRNKRADGGEGYSGSTAWHNSSRSRLFLTRGADGLLTLEHQKSNLGQMREPITLEWPNDGQPQLREQGAEFEVDELIQNQQGRADEAKAASLLRMIAEFEGRGQYCHTGLTSRSNPFAMLSSEPSFQKLRLNKDATKRIVNLCQRAKWLDSLDYRTPDRKPHQRWTLTAEGRTFAGLPAPTAPIVPTIEVSTSMHMAQGGAPTAPTGVGGTGDRARAQEEN